MNSSLLAVLSATTSFALAAASLQAATWYVDNQPGHAADFPSLADALTAAEPGDTLHLAGSPVDYGVHTISKPVHLVGPGTFLGSNFDRLPQSRPATSAQLTFGAGSAGSSCTALRVTNFYIRDRDITVRRCHTNFISMDGGGTLTGLFVLQNWIDSYISSNPNGHVVDAVIAGNRIGYITLDSGDSVLFHHNIVIGTSSVLHHSQVHSNLWLSANSGMVTFYDSSVTHNLAVGGTSVPAFLAGSGNVTAVESAALFAPGRGLDLPYLLAENSPALTAGLSGSDAGMFGGPYPYVAGGVPPGPRIIRLEVPAAASPTSGLRIEVEAVSQP